MGSTGQDVRVDRQHGTEDGESVRANMPTAFAEAGDLATALAAGFVRGRAAWSTVQLDPRSFAKAVLAHAQTMPGDVRANVETLRLDELYLATACAEGSSGAILAFEKVFLNEIFRAFRSRSLDEVFLDEVRQHLRERLFVGHAGRAGEIATYAGRGSLRRWFRIVLLHHALHFVRQEAHAPTPIDRQDDDALLAPSDPELDYLRERLSTDFRAATEEAARRVTPGDRLLLWHHYVEHLSIDRVAAIYEVHRVTAARRVNRARDKFVHLVREVLTTRFGLDERELPSILDTLSSRLSISFGRILASS